MTKDRAIGAINDLPEDFEVDDLIEKLIFIDKVEKGLEQVKNREVITHEEMKKVIRGWQK